MCIPACSLPLYCGDINHLAGAAFLGQRMMERCVEWGEAEARFREVKITSPCRALVTFHRTKEDLQLYNPSSRI